MKELTRANKIKNELDELERFLFSADRVWTGKLTLKKIISNAYGMFRPCEYNMQTDIKNKVLLVLHERRINLEEELKALFKEPTP